MRAPDFWTSDSNGAKALAVLLSPFGVLYGLSVRAREKRARPFRPKARVLCVGNLTAGGSGKTPIAIALGRMLTARGKRIVFLARGYAGRFHGPIEVDPARHSFVDVGDEPLLLSAHAPTIVARDRAAGAMLADSLEADVIVMDDGFQNFGLIKDFSLLVIDAEMGFGNGCLIPAGPLREPVAQGLTRADGIVLVGDGEPPLPAFPKLTLRAHLVPNAPEALARRQVLAFAGIGRPEKFFQTLRKLGATIVATQAFPDHHRFGSAELSALKLAAEGAGALLVTTEKDYARLAPTARVGILPVPVHAVFINGGGLVPLLDRIAEARNVQET